MSDARTIGAMDDRSARRDLTMVAVTVVGLSRLVDPPLIWLVAAALLGAMLLGTLQVLHDEATPVTVWFGVPIESVILPSVAAVGCLGAIRLVPFGLWLLPALAVTWLIVGRALALEDRINRKQTGLSAEDRTAVLVTILLVAFLGFTGVAAMVPGRLGPADPGVLPIGRVHRPRALAPTGLPLFPLDDVDGVAAFILAQAQRCRYLPGE